MSDKWLETIMPTFLKKNTCKTNPSPTVHFLCWFQLLKSFKSVVILALEIRPSLAI